MNGPFSTGFANAEPFGGPRRCHLILYFARAVLIPLALALTLNFLLTPMVIWFQKFRIRRVPAVALVMLISVAVVGGLGWVVTKQLLEVANDLPKYRLNIHNKIEALHSAPDSALGRATESVEEISKEFSEPGASPSAPSSDLSKPVSPQTTSPSKTLSQPAGPLPVQVVATPPVASNPFARWWVRYFNHWALPEWF